MANRKFHKLQAEEMIKKANSRHTLEQQRNDLLTAIAHALIANIEDDDEG